MKRILDFLKKYDTPLTYGIVLLIFGIAFVFMPEQVLDWIVGIAGGVTILLSLIKLAVLFENKENDPLFSLGIVRVCIFAFLGIMLVILRSNLASAICALLGLYIVISSAAHIIALTHNPTLPKGASWTADIVLSAVLIALGLWLIIYPLWPRLLIGVAMILLGIEFIGKSPGKKSEKKDKEGPHVSGGVYYTDEFEDKSDDLN